MNCDQAFDYLTDSARRDSGSLARHLAGCARCRQLKETLEPALGLFDELVPEPGIAAYEGTAPAAGDESVRIAEQSAARLSRRSVLSAVPVRGAVRYAAVFLFGAALVYGLTMPVGPGDDSTTPRSICPWKNRTDADDAGIEARAVVLSCLDCHDPSRPIDDVSTLNLDALGRSFSLTMQPGEWLAFAQLPPGPGRLVSGIWEATT